MQIVIDIPDEEYDVVQNEKYHYIISHYIWEAVKNGVVLPKGHERLIEANKLLQAMKNRDADNGGEPLNAIDRGYHLAVEHLQIEIDHAPTVIEADKE